MSAREPLPLRAHGRTRARVLTSRSRTRTTKNTAAVDSIDATHENENKEDCDCGYTNKRPAGSEGNRSNAADESAAARSALMQQEQNRVKRDQELRVQPSRLLMNAQRWEAPTLRGWPKQMM